MNEPQSIPEPIVRRASSDGGSLCDECPRRRSPVKPCFMPTGPIIELAWRRLRGQASDADLASLPGPLADLVRTIVADLRTAMGLPPNAVLGAVSAVEIPRPEGKLSAERLEHFARRVAALVFAREGLSGVLAPAEVEMVLALAAELTARRVLAAHRARIRWAHGAWFALGLAAAIALRALALWIGG
ncbi:MAG TPA: hypothetical protein VMZ50_06930 [Phycisphaerae bacterium]|nr:hypothetical protein [Phycisphaerae bacterium]HUX16881.1 hypothetical protein [Phycisphaerae bacterium]